MSWVPSPSFPNQSGRWIVPRHFLARSSSEIQVVYRTVGESRRGNICISSHAKACRASAPPGRHCNHALAPALGECSTHTAQSSSLPDGAPSPFKVRRASCCLLCRRLRCRRLPSPLNHPFKPPQQHRSLYPLPIWRAAVISAPRQHSEVTTPDYLLASIVAPTTAVGPAPLQKLQIPALRRCGTRLLPLGIAIRPAPIHRLQRSRSGGCRKKGDSTCVIS